MARTRRIGVISLTERAESIRTAAGLPARTAGRGAPCEHWSGCRRPWTTWTIRGGRCDHHPLQPHEIPTIREHDRQPWVRSHRTSTLARGEDPHPYVRDPMSGRARTCVDCGLGYRARLHTAAEPEEGTR